MAQTAAEYEAALAAITDGAKYRISTDVDGTKYYVTAGGTLTNVKAKGDAFAFAKITEGGEYVVDSETGTKAVGIQLTSSAGTRFTNAPLSDNKAVLNVSNYSTTTGNRANWESQVFFLKDGKFAIRSCNVYYAESSWQDAGRTFWTYTVDPVDPEYSYDPAYVWELEEYTETPEQIAALAKVQAWPAYIQSAAGLVKDASKFSSNAKDPGEGSYEALVDGEYTTFFHSSWHGELAPDEDHYLQTELAQATQKFEFYYKKRSQNNNNRPTTLVITGSNDGTTFSDPVTISEGLPTDASVIDYMSGQIDLGAAYKYVRFTVPTTNSGNANNNHVFFTFSEFYMFPGNDAAAQLAPLYNNYSSALAGDLTEQDVAQINAIDMALKTAIATVTVTYELYEADGTTLVGSKEVVQKPYSDIEIPSSLQPNSTFYTVTTEGTIGDTDCTIKIIRTLKPEVVGALDELSNNKAYYVSCDRGKFLTKDGYLASTAHSSLKEAEPSTFAIINYEDNYYLYSVADGKFVKNDGALAGDLVTEGFHGVYDAIQMTPQAVPYFFWYFTISEGTNYGLNTNGNDPYGYVINNWMNADPGNLYYMVADADFDPANAVAALQAYFHPSYTVTYVVKDTFGKTIFTSDPQPTTAGTVITTLPNEYKRAFYTYNDVNVTVENISTTAEFTATWTGPFELSADFASARWYNMTMRGTWYVTSAEKSDDGAYVTQNNAPKGEQVKDSYQWAFTGNGYEGIKILNKAEGEGKSFGWTDENQKDAGIPTVMADTEGHHGWKIVASTSGDAPANSFCLNVAGTNLYPNQYGGTGKPMKFWNSGNNVGDAGAAFTVYDVPTFAEAVTEGIAPYFEGNYFVLNDEAKAAVGYDPAYKESCSSEAYQSMTEKMTDEFLSNTSNYVLPETGVYFLKNKNYGTFMGIDPSDANLYGNYKAADQLKHYVTLTKTGDATYNIGLMGKYAPATVTQSAQVTANADAGTYTVVITSGGYAAFQADTENNMSSLHCAGGGSVVGWEPTADASQWAVEDATSINLTIDESGYATAYLPFPVEVGTTLSVPAAKGAWTFDDGTTGSLTATDGVTVADGIVTVPKGDNLTMATGVTELGTYTFMFDVMLPDDANGRYSALFQNKPANDGDGSLFIYNHKTNGRKVGLNAGGLGYGGTIELGAWYRIVFSCENSTPSLYVNGVKVGAATAAVEEHWLLKDKVLFFTDNDGEENEILADEIRFWDVALTADEVAMLGAYGDPEPVSEGVSAYTGIIKGEWLSLTPVTGTIPAQTAVVLKGEPAVYEFAISADAEPIEENDLQGTLEPIEAVGKYVLAQPQGEEIGFYEATSGTIKAGKAYLEVESGVKAFLFTGDDATGIANIEKNVENGLIYNVAGQRLSKMQKGINIVNGKKVLK